MHTYAETHQHTSFLQTKGRKKDGGEKSNSNFRFCISNKQSSGHKAELQGRFITLDWLFIFKFQSNHTHTLQAKTAAARGPIAIFGFEIEKK